MERNRITDAISHTSTNVFVNSQFKTATMNIHTKINVLIRSLLLIIIFLSSYEWFYRYASNITGGPFYFVSNHFGFAQISMRFLITYTTKSRLSILCQPSGFFSRTIFRTCAMPQNTKYCSTTSRLAQCRSVYQVGIPSITSLCNLRVRLRIALRFLGRSGQEF